MIDHRAKILFAFLLVIQLSATLEKKDCRNWDQSDQVISTRDYGVSGIAGPVNLNLEPELQPGSVISVVSKTASRAQISLLNDDREYLLHIDARDQVLFSKDYGVDGIKGPLNITLVPGVQSGAVISVVTKTSNRGQTNLMDNKDVILHVDARISSHGENHLMLSTYMRGIWRPDYRQLINPIASGAKVTTTIIYEPNGCRIFINGREIAFYDHRNFKKPTVLNLEHDLVYKVMYLTTVKI